MKDDCSQSGSTSAAWQRLHEHATETEPLHLATLFDRDSDRFQKFSLRAGPLLLDISKQRITESTLTLLNNLADSCNLRGWIDRLFAGDPINDTENRAALHWVLRLPIDNALSTNHEVEAELDKMAGLVARLHASQWRGCSGEAITDVVNIGVGGSDLGPLMVSYALEETASEGAKALRLHFVSSMDGSQLSQLLAELKPQNTLFIVSSKSFTTVDTLSNAATARSWLVDHFGDRPAVTACHFIAVSARPERMSEWGIPVDNQLLLWDWVGGRFSLWSCIGFAIALRIGMAGFRQLLAGAHFMDEHFRWAPWRENLPVLLALTGVWNNNFLGIRTHAILPYDGRLRYLPPYLTQLEMESNGKSVTRDGQRVSYETCPVIWGEVGPNAQHAFYQLLHQGTQPVSCDFIAPIARSHNGQHQQSQSLSEQHRLTLANCIAQSRLLALGDRALGQAVPEALHRRYRGNQPSSTILLDQINPYALGALLAAYEHKVFAQSVIWGINPFDQWGVEMGKRLAVDTLDLLQGGSGGGELDTSTRGLAAEILGQAR